MYYTVMLFPVNAAPVRVEKPNYAAAVTELVRFTEKQEKGARGGFIANQHGDIVISILENGDGCLYTHEY